MKKPMIFILLGVLVVGALVVGLVAMKSKQPTQQTTAQPDVVEDIAPADASITTTVTWSKVKDNTVVLAISGLANKYSKVAYEISYESKGVVQGVTSRPLDISGTDTFTRDDIYLGTCSKNVCTPHTGVKKVSVVLEFTDTAGKKSQLTKDFDL
jgi:hypothetical protein